MTENIPVSTIRVEPDPSALIEAFRAIGYSPGSAVADLVDNSVSARATEIHIRFDWKGKDSWLSIIDNGHGMDEEELINAMRPGSRNPLEERAADDLGRFGLGLKTASFSQAERLTIISKKEITSPVSLTWDLEHVRNSRRWELLCGNNQEAAALFPEEYPSGTVVIWNRMDRIVSNADEYNLKAMDKFMTVMEEISRHLSMVFHRYIENGNIRIFFQERLLSPWNPFLEKEAATIAFPEEMLHNDSVRIKGYVLPHRSRLDEETYRKAEGIKGWNEQQGFYIYRNNRLLCAGGWSGFFSCEEHYKLVRIRIDIPNNMDSEWQIDIRKSRARPPVVCRDQLRAYAKKVRAQGLEVFRHRGQIIRQKQETTLQPLWLPHRQGENWSFVINREHPVIRQLKEDALTHPEQAMEKLLRFVEETVPGKSVFICEAEHPDRQSVPFSNSGQEGEKVIRETLFSMYHNLLEQGKDHEQACSVISRIDPFHHYIHLLETEK